MKRNRISTLVFGSLVLSSCLIGACATAESQDLGGPSARAYEPGTAGSSGSDASGASPGGAAGSTGVAGTSVGGAAAGSSAGGSGSTTSNGTAGAGSGGKGGSGGVAGAASGGKGGSGAASGAGGGLGAGGKGGSGATGGGSATGGGGATGGSGGAGSGGTTSTAGSGGSGTVVKIDLSTFQPTGVGTYNSTSQTLTVMAQPFFQFPLPKTFTTGQSVAVHVTGTNNGTAGLRSWLVNSSQTTLSNVVTTYVGTGLPSGSFTLDYTLTATDAVQFLFFKGPMVGTNIDNVTIATITITY